ncbi:MAG: hypothetical protein HWD61_14120 [Parachlamydiaceae bacterium]|nr:MAG: hypothetical protein HWD61_14120 [Parachlamydiaceae bacterium]
MVASIGASAKDGQHMGRVYFVITGKQTQTVQNQVTREEELNLKWGERKALMTSQNEKFTKLTLNEFDGKNIEFTGPNRDNKYVQVVSEGESLVVQATQAKDVTS